MSRHSDEGMSKADDDDESIIPSLANTIHQTKCYSVEQKAMPRKTFGTLAKKTIILKSEVSSLLMKNRDVLAKKDIITICP